MDATLIVSSFDRFSLPVPMVTVDDRSTTIWLTGEQDIAVVEALRDALSAEQQSPSADVAHVVVVDLRGVTFIDTSTAQALIDATVATAGSALAVTLRAPSECVRRMLAICGRADLLDTA
jgi:anti-anti-sigma factor